MAVHDAYVRITPYELLLPEPGFADERFPAISDEAAERGADPGNPAAFITLAAVQALLAELREEDAAPETALDHGSVLYFGYHMWRAGAAAALVPAEALRGLVRGGGRQAPLPPGAGYVQFAQHLVWLETGGGAPGAGGEPVPESADGFFWAVDGRGILHLALVAGMRGDRPGFGLAPAPPIALDSLPGWAAGPAREGGADFETSLPGAELDGLLGVRTPAELFRLAALILPLVASARPAPPPGDPGSGPRPTSLPAASLRLVG